MWGWKSAKKPEHEHEVKETPSKRKFEINFAFELSVVGLPNNEFFSPTRDAIDRWVLQEPPAYQGLGPSFQILYELATGEFVFVRYECCELLAPTTELPKVWRSTSRPRGQKISQEQAFRWLSNGQLEIPESLKHMPAELSARQSKPATEPIDRPLEHWSKSLPEHGEQQIPACIAEFRTLAQKLIDGTVILIHQIRGWADGVSPGTLPPQLPSFLSAIRKRYQVNQSNWWGDPAAIAPKDTGIEGLPWPSDLEICRKHLAQIKDLVVLPILVLVQARRPQIGNAYHPTQSEFQNAWRTLVDRLPDIEQSAVAVRRELLSESKPQLEPTPAITITAASSQRDEDIEREILRRDMETLSDFEWKILGLLKKNGFTSDQIEQWATQSLISEWLEKLGVNGALKSVLSNLKKHDWLTSRDGNKKGGGYILTPKGLSALELRSEGQQSKNQSD